MKVVLKKAVLVCLVSGFAASSSVASNIDVQLGVAGNGASFSTMQPSLVLNPIVRLIGDSSEIGEVKWFGGNFAPAGWAVAHGALLDINSNQALFDKLGTTYGGNGNTTFALPDLRGRAIVGTGRRNRNGPTYSLGETVGSADVSLTVDQMAAHSHGTDDGTSSSAGGSAPFNNMQPTMALDFEIFDQGTYPSPNLVSDPQQGIEGTLAFVRMDAAMDGVGQTNKLADGSLVAVAQNTALFSLLGTTYGGDGETTFALPDIGGRVVVGQGSGPGLTPRSLGSNAGSETTTMTFGQLPAHAHSDPDHGASHVAGASQQIENRQPDLALNFVISLGGVYPTFSLPGLGSVVEPAPVEPIFQNLSSDPFVGEIGLFAGNFAPPGWAFAAGQILAVRDNVFLFSILGTTFGGDGETTFGLPDLRGRTPIGAGLNFRIGQRLGGENLVLTTANLPPHSHTVERVAPVPLPAPVLPLLSALAGLWLLRRNSGIS